MSSCSWFIVLVEANTSMGSLLRGESDVNILTTRPRDDPVLTRLGQAPLIQSAPNVYVTKAFRYLPPMITLQSLLDRPRGLWLLMVCS